MRNIYGMMMVFVLVGLVCFPVYAQERNYYVSAHGLYAFENTDDDKIKGDYSCPLDVSLDNSYGIQLKFGTAWNRYFALEFMAEYILPFEDNQEGTSIETDAIGAYVNGKFIWNLSPSLIPYATVGFGVVNSKKDIQWKDVSCENVNWGTGARIGIGIDIPFSIVWYAEIEAASMMGMGDVDYLRYSMISIGIGYRF